MACVRSQPPEPITAMQAHRLSCWKSHYLQRAVQGASKNGNFHQQKWLHRNFRLVNVSGVYCCAWRTLPAWIRVCHRASQPRKRGAHLRQQTATQDTSQLEASRLRRIGASDEWLLAILRQVRGATLFWYHILIISLLSGTIHTHRRCSRAPCLTQ